MKTLDRRVRKDRNLVRRAIITGGAGYVGSHLVDALARRSVRMTVGIRRSTPPEAVDFVRSCGASVCEVDYRGGADLSKPFASCDVWFHLIGSIQRLRGDSFEHRHRDITAHLVTQAGEGSIERIVFLSALGAAARARNVYLRTKWQAEREIAESGIPSAIIRPGLIVGLTAGSRNSRLVERYIGMIRKGRATVLGDGRNLIQPIDVRDVVECLILSAGGESSGMTAHDIGGRDQIQSREFVVRLADSLGQKRVAVKHLPLWVARLLARVLEVVQKTPSLTRELVAFAREDNVCAVDSIRSQFGFKPRPLEKSLETYRTRSD